MATINGTNGNNILNGTSGADTINALGGNDVINAGSGNDLVYAGSGNDLVYGGAGNDIIYGGSGIDYLWGGDGDDQIFGETGSDFLFGGSGNDVLDGGSGSDAVFGDDGNDTIIYKIAENQDAIDGADGGSGSDRLIVHVTSAQFNAIQASGAIAAFNASNKSYLFSFGCFNLPFDFDLVVTRIETLQFQIIGGNAAPVVVNDTKALTEDSTTGLTGNVLTNDSDPDGPNALVVSNPRTENIMFGATVIGTVQLLSTGAYTVTLNAAAQTMNVGNVATLNMSYGASDGLATTNGTLTITVNGANDAAVITGPVVRTVIEAGGVANGTPGTPTATGTLTSTDVDNAANSFTAVAAGAASVNGYGTFSMTAAGVWTYTLNNNNAAVQALNVGGTLTDTFTVTSIDGTPKVINITIQGANDKATITGTSTGAVTEDATSPNLTVSGTLTATDVDNPAGFIAGTIAGTYGSVTINAAGAWTYKALNSQSAIQNLNTGQTLTDTLTVQSVDGTAKNIVITINGVNEPVVNVAPVANNDTLAATEDTPITYTAAQLLGNDVDLDGPNPLSIASVTSISGGTVVLNGNGTVTFTPTLNFNGAASFSYIATDGALNSNAATVTVNVAAVNDAPVAVANTVANIAEDSGAYTISGATILGNDTDVDVGDTKSLVSVSVATPGAGTVSIVAGNVVFNPTLNYNGPVVLNYTMRDAAGAQSSSTISFNVTSVNDAAVISGTVTGSVVEAGGVANGIPGTPTATGTLTSTDVDNPANTFTAVAAGAATVNGYGTFAMTAAGVWTYTLNNNNSAVQALNVGGTLSDSFTVTSIDGTPKVINITINGTNDVAVISGTSSGSVVEAGGVANGIPGTPTATGTLVVSDVDSSNAVIVQNNVATTYGFFSIDGAGNWTYNLDNTNAATQGIRVGQTRTDTIVVTTADGTTQTIAITVNGTNDAPVAVDDSFTGLEDNTITGNVRSNDTDIDTLVSTLPIELVTGPSHAASFVLNADGSFSYTPVANFDGTDTFTYQIREGGDIDIGTVTLTLTPTPDAPTALADVKNVVEDSPLNPVSGNVLANDSDPDAGDVLTVNQISIGSTTLPVSGATPISGTYGQLTMNTDGSYSYQLNNNDPLVNALQGGGMLHDIFTYRVTDTQGHQVTTTLDVTIHGANDNPTVTIAPSNNILEDDLSGNSVTGNVITGSTIFDPDSLPTNFFTNSGVFAGAHGTLSLNLLGAYQYTLNNADPAVNTLNAGDVLDDTFTYTLNDGDGGTTSATLTIHILGANDAPVVITPTPLAHATELGFSTAGSDAVGNVFTGLVLSDPDDTVFTVTPQVVSSAYGTLTLLANGSYTYAINNANAQVNGLQVGQSITDSFFYTVVDDHGASVVTSLDVQIHGSNDAPTAAVLINQVASEDAVSDGNTALVYTIPISAILQDGNVTDPDDLSGFDFGFASGDGLVITRVGDNLEITITDAAAVNALNAGDTKVFSINAQIIDPAMETAGELLGLSKIFTLTINGVNETPVVAIIGGDVTGNTVEDSNIEGSDFITATGQLTIVDPNPGEAAFFVNTYPGFYGDLSVDSDGTWTYTADNTQSTIQALGEGEVLHLGPNPYSDLFLVLSADGTQQAIEITITGANDMHAVASVSVSANEDQVDQTFSFGAITDVDVNDTHTITLLTQPTLGTVINNNDGSFNFNPGTAFNHLAVGETESVSFDYLVTDQNGNEVRATATLVVTGANDAPTIVAIQDINTDDNQSPFDIDLMAYAQDIDLSNVLNISNIQIFNDTASGVTLNGTVLHIDPQAYDARQTGQGPVTLQIVFNVSDGVNTIINQLTILVNGANDAPQITTPISVVTSEDSAPLFVSDIVAASGVTDIDDTNFTAEPGTYVGSLGGTLVIAPNVSLYSYTYTVNNANPLINALNVGSTPLQETFTYTIHDAHGGSATATFTATINGSNDAPTILPPFFENDSVDEDAAAVAVDGNVITDWNNVYFQDADSPITGFTVTPGPFVGTYGTLILSANGNYDYQLNNANPAVNALNVGQTLQDAFLFNMQDGNGGVLTSNTLKIDIKGTNDGPVAVADVRTITEDDAVISGNVMDNDSDVDSSIVGWTVTAETSTPILFGSIEIGTVVMDSSGAYTVTLNANAQAMDDGESATVNVPYTMNDGSGASTVSSLAVTVNGTNDAPVVQALTINTDNNGNPLNDDTPDLEIPFARLLTGQSDVDDALSVVPASVSIVGSPAGVSIVGNTIQIDPQAYDSLGVSGSASIQVNYQVTDGTVVVNNTATIVIAGANDAPTVDVQIPDQTMVEDTFFSLTLDAATYFNDVDSLESGFTLQVINKPIWMGFDGTTLSGIPNGTGVNSLAGSWVHYYGDVSITVEARDANGATVTDTFILTITSDNDAPNVVNDSRVLTENEGRTTALTGNVLSNGDFDDDNLDADPNAQQTLTVVLQAPTNIINTLTGHIIGTVSIATDGTYSIALNSTADEMTQGQSIFVNVNYNVSDGVDTTAAILAVQVNGVNDAPTVPVAPNNFSTDDNSGSFTIAPATLLLAGITDPDGVVGIVDGSIAFSNDPMGALSLTTGPGPVGLIAVDPAKYDYLAVNESITIRVDFDVTDGIASPIHHYAEVVINGANDAPTVVTLLPDITIKEDTAFSPYSVAQNFKDVDASDTLTYSLDVGSSIPAGMSFSSAGVLSGTPTTSGNYSLTVVATDSQGATALNTFNITVTATPNVAPIANPDAITFNEDGVKDPIPGPLTGNVIANDTDADGPSGLSIVDFGPIDFLWWNHAGEGGTVAHLDLAQNGDYAVTLNPFTQSMDITDHLVYTFNYQVWDGSLITQGTMTVTINGVNDAPEADPTTAISKTDNDAVFTIDVVTLMNGVTDAESNPLHVDSVVISGDLPGSVTVDLANNVTIDPTAYTTPTTIHIEYDVVDSHGALVHRDQVVNIGGANDGPTVINTIPDYMIVASLPFAYPIAAFNPFFDEDGDTLTYSAAGLPNGLSINTTTGEISGTPDSNFIEPAFITVTATDPSGAFASTGFYLTPAGYVVGQGDNTDQTIDFSASTSPSFVTGDTAGVFVETTVAQQSNDTILINEGTAVGDSVTNDGHVDVSGDDDITIGDNGGNAYGDYIENTSMNTLVTAGNETIRGGAAIDYMVGDVNKNTGQIITAGNDLMEGGGGDDVIVGDVYNNLSGILTTAGADFISGGTGDDTIFGDVVFGVNNMTNAGADYFRYDLDINNGHDTIWDFNFGLDTFRVTKVDDTDGNAGLTAGDLHRVLDMSITGGSYVMSLAHSTSIDTISLRNHTPVVRDTFAVSALLNTVGFVDRTFHVLLGTNGNDAGLTSVLVGKVAGNLIFGFDGNDTLVGDGELNALNAVDASVNDPKILDDILSGGNGADTLIGDFGQNFGTISKMGNDYLDGDLGGVGSDDFIVGDVQVNHGTIVTAGNDRIFGGGGNDVLIGDVQMNFGTVITQGIDTFVYDLAMDSGHDIILDFQAGNASTPSRDKILLQDFLNGSIEAINNGAFYSLVLKDASSVQVGQIDLFGVPLTADTRLTLQIDYSLDGVDTTQTLVLGANVGVMPIPTIPFVTILGNDTLTGTVSGSEIMFGFSGDDTLTGDAVTNVLIVPGTGSDRLVGAEGNDTLYGDLQTNNGYITNMGADTLLGGIGDDVIYGDAANNLGTIVNAGSDTIEAGDGNDIIYGDVAQGFMAANGGDDFIDGGADVDLVVYKGAAANFDASLIGTNFFRLIDGTGQESSTGIGDRLINVELIEFAGTRYFLNVGSDAAATSTGNILRDYILAFEGVDIIYGDGNVRSNSFLPAANDVILAGGGDDLIFGDFASGVLPALGGNDEINGGAGLDTAFYRTAGSDAALSTINFTYVGDNDAGGLHNANTFQIISAAEGTDTLSNVERVSIDNGTARLYDVHTGSGVVVGDSFGNDLIIASGAATLIGDDTPLTASATNSGHDILVGSSLNDTLVGDRLALIGPLAIAGSDVLKGGDGDDMLIGDVSGALASVGGNDYLDGGAGVDTAAYSQDVSAFGFTYLDSTTFSISSTREGIDQLKNVEKLRFNGNSYTIMAGSNNADSMKGSLSVNEIILGFLGAGVGDSMWGDGSFNILAQLTPLSDDILVGTDDNDSLFGDFGSNLAVVVQAGDDVLIGGAGNDQLYGDMGAYLMANVGGNDEIDGGTGTDTAHYLGGISGFSFVYLGDNDGTGIHNSSTIRLISLTEGLDTLTNIERIDFGGVTYTITYTQFPGSTFGTSGNDFLISLGSVNVLGFSEMEGGLGDDIILGGNVRDIIYGDLDGTATAVARAGDDRIFAGGGNDDIIGDIRSGPLAVIGGNDEINGGTGTDRALYRGNISAMNFEFVGDDDGAGLRNASTFRVIDTTGHEGTDTLTDVEILGTNGITGPFSNFVSGLQLNIALGTNGDDFGVTGVTDGNNLVLGFNSGANGDVLFGDTGSGILGADYLVGSSQGDVLFGDSNTILDLTTGGNDSLDGRGGIDTAAYKGAESNFQFQNFAGVLRVIDASTREGIDDLMNMERISFNTQIAFGGDPLGNIYDIVPYTTSNTWTGTSANELFVAADGVTPLTLYGDLGTTLNLVASNDFIQGASGNDNIFGDIDLGNGIYQHGGNDIILGGLGNDNIWGDGGTNTVRALIGGNDVIDGGAGTDTAKYGATASINSFTINYIGNNDGLGRHDDTTFQFVDMSGRDGTDTLTSIEQITFGSTLYKVVVAASSITNGSVASNDIMVGTNGSETLVGDYAGGSPISTASADIIFAGGGSDILVGDNVDTAPSIGGNDQLFGGAGDDIAKYKGTYDSLTFTYIGDTDGATGPRNASTFQISSVQAGTDVLTDIEKLSFDGVVYRIHGLSAGNALGGETLTFDPLAAAFAVKDIVFGFAGNDVLMGDDTPSILQGSASDDILLGGEGNDDLYGDSKDGIFWTVGGNNLIDGGNGTDTLHYINASSAQNVVFDYLAGSNFTKLKATDVTGVEGVNTFFNVEKVQYGSGGQTYSIVATGFLNITGTNATNQLIVGTDLNNTLQGDTDGSTAAFSNDILFGGKGDDKLIGDALDAATLSSTHTGGNDTLFGGDGIDTAVYQGDFSHFVIQYSGIRGTEKMYNVIDVTNHEGTDMLIGVERIQFGGLSQPSYDLNNLSVGTNLADTLTHAVGAGAGLSFSVAQLNASHALSLFNTNNLIYGFDGNDSIEGNHFVGSVDSGIITGNDLIDGGAGNDEISGDSSLIFQHTYLAPNGVTVLYGSSGKLTIAGSDHIVGGDGNDNLYGDVKINVGGTLYSAGHDTLEGGAGNDLLVGDVFSNDRATDTTTGAATFFSAGNDVLFGGESADILVGDTYSGFQEVTPGHDTFVYDFRFCALM